MSPDRSADRARFEAALAPHLDELYGAAVRLTRSRADADDVLQEAMTRAWAFWDRFQEGTNARAWMHRILFNTFVKFSSHLRMSTLTSFCAAFASST